MLHFYTQPKIYRETNAIDGSLSLSHSLTHTLTHARAHTRTQTHTPFKAHITAQCALLTPPR